ncbi:MAG: hypothetical protein ACI8Y6_001347, partial [Brevundimonas sp.]
LSSASETDVTMFSSSSTRVILAKGSSPELPVPETENARQA